MYRVQSALPNLVQVIPLRYLLDAKSYTGASDIPTVVSLTPHWSEHIHPHEYLFDFIIISSLWCYFDYQSTSRWDNIFICSTFLKYIYKTPHTNKENQHTFTLSWYLSDLALLCTALLSLIFLNFLFVDSIRLVICTLKTDYIDRCTLITGPCAPPDHSDQSTHYFPPYVLIAASYLLLKVEP